MLEWALTFYMVLGFEDCWMWNRIVAMRSLSRWLCWEDGLCMWLFKRKILLRLFVNMKIGF